MTHRLSCPYDQARQHIKKQRHYCANKGSSSQAYGFSSSHVWIWELDRKESWVPKNWCFWTVVLEKTLQSPLDYKEIQPVHPKEDQSWVFLEGLMLKLKLQYFGQLMERTDSLEKTLMLGKIKGGRMRWLDGITDLMDMSLSKLQEALLLLWHGANQLTSLDFWFLFCIMRGLENMIKILLHPRSCFTFRSTKPHICLFISIIGVRTICFLKNIILKRFSFKHFFPRVSWFFYRVLLYVAEQWRFTYWLNDLFSPGFLRGLK